MSSVRASHLLIKHAGSRRAASWKDESGAIIGKRTKEQVRGRAHSYEHETFSVGKYAKEDCLESPTTAGKPFLFPVPHQVSPSSWYKSCRNSQQSRESAWCIDAACGCIHGRRGVSNTGLCLSRETHSIPLPCTNHQPSQLGQIEKVKNTKSPWRPSESDDLRGEFWSHFSRFAQTVRVGGTVP
ncbi:hypothetical protein T484DRAFT_1668878 [Baffinella frigidus]|nr:hypothetical protein T484DRAFT_1668878 [Cryptophyta sp. CCMP2293]